MLLLGIDFETTGLDATKDRITELGACLWDSDTKAPIAVFCCYLFDDDYPLVTKEITALTGITDEAIAVYGRAPREAFGELAAMVTRAEMIVAHNGTNFDKLFYKAELERQGRLAVPAGKKFWLGIPWLDTSVDVPYPDKIQTRKLVHLAAEHGFVNPFAHRALFDVMTMMHILSCYNIEDVVRLAAEPSYDVVAKTLPPWQDEGKSNEKAKARGYRWDGANKRWFKTVKKSQVEKEQSHGEFPVVVTERTA